MEERTSTMIRTPDREVWFFVKDKKSDNVISVPAFLYFGFLNNLYFDDGFNIEAAGKIENRKICQIIHLWHFTYFNSSSQRKTIKTACSKVETGKHRKVGEGTVCHSKLSAKHWLLYRHGLFCCVQRSLILNLSLFKVSVNYN